MSSVLQQLVQRSEGGNADVDLHAAAEGDGAEDAVVEEPAEGAAKTAADRAREILRGSAGIEAECFEAAAGLRGEMEKTAAEGGDTTDQEATADFFEKVATTLRIQRVYAENLRKQGEANARTCEALKVASDLMEKGLLDPSDNESMAQTVEKLAKRDLKAVKVASEMFADAALTNALGSAEKIASDKNQTRRLDGSMESWAEAHAWLYQ